MVLDVVGDSVRDSRSRYHRADTYTQLSPHTDGTMVELSFPTGKGKSSSRLHDGGVECSP